MLRFHPASGSAGDSFEGSENSAAAQWLLPRVGDPSIFLYGTSLTGVTATVEHQVDDSDENSWVTSDIVLTEAAPMTAFTLPGGNTRVAVVIGSGSGVNVVIKP